MRIESIEFGTESGLPRWSARILYEDRMLEAPRLTVASEALSGDFPPVAFFLLTMLPGALATGERRVRVEGDLDRSLADLVGMAMGRQSSWFFQERPIPVIEATGRFELARPRGPGAALLLSGGVDSMAMLRRLGRWFPPGHSRAITDAFVVEGFDLSLPGQEAQGDFFRRLCDRLRPVCESRGVRLCPVHTNLRHPALAPASWPDLHFGLAGVAVGHAFTHRVRELHMAGGQKAADLYPHGSHPLVDPFGSGGELRVHHHLVDLGRLDRVRSIAGEPDLTAALRVCWAGIRNEGPPNCGVCHKCVMTRLELLAAGIPDECAAFSQKGVTARDVLMAIRENTPHSLPFLKELLAPLEERGRPDLVAALRKKIKRLEKSAQCTMPKGLGWPSPRRPWWRRFL